MLTQDGGACTSAGCVARPQREESVSHQLGAVSSVGVTVSSGGGEQGRTGQSCPGEQVPAAQRREVRRSGERSQQVSRAGQGKWEDGEGTPGAERGPAKVLPAGSGEPDLDKDPGRCESPE